MYFTGIIPDYLAFRNVCGHMGTLAQTPSIFRAGHGWIRGFLAGNGIYVVALNSLNILQFFSCKSVENWLSYAFAKFEVIEPKCDGTACPHGSQKGKLIPAQPHFWIVWVETWQRHNSVNSQWIYMNFFAKYSENSGLQEKYHYPPKAMDPPMSSPTISPMLPTQTISFTMDRIWA